VILLAVLAAPLIFLAFLLLFLVWLAQGLVEYWRETQASRPTEVHLAEVEPAVRWQREPGGGYVPQSRSDRR
jgi:hypothetical protein